ncbi:iron-sulfur cluster repair di-iron protein [Paenibacillus sp. GD4]|uniref:iron-sulfur cluster repair di-iron protein n=1 Tax=Paenibacillus sp. GD4 TaxID=3068890 RepID=UPI00279693A4|nr:iron-sulfur cluster repair di-iron protein [Paenibacillus sp. GD4]MDQ1909914.1 iron-sulfur cluster repair di-iron protein [Paenibacillus sp. GD4]
MKFQATETVGSIVTAFPGASNVFRAHRIDFCCGGQRPLAEVLEQSGLSEQTVLQELEDAYERAALRERQQDFRRYTRSELISHIVTVHHDFLRSELPLLGEFVEKIARVHGPSHKELIELRALYQQLREELEEHLLAEEERVFPMVRAYEATGDAGTKEEALRAIDELESEHDKAGALLREMRAVTVDYTLPEGACRTYTVAFQKLEQLEADMFQHIHLENNILFQSL